MFRHLTPSTLIALLALVFAITGGAFAATGGGSASHATLTASAAKAKPKVKTGPRGPAGPKGAAGPAGATGPSGPTGPGGAQGPQGPQGTAGANGTNGEKGEKGEQGAKGVEGKQGVPGTTGYTETLPPGKTETGAWSFSLVQGSGGREVEPFAQISFPIPLAAALLKPGCVEAAEPCLVHYVKDGKEVIEIGFLVYEEVEASKECSGTAEKPTAGPGNLCVYESATENIAKTAPGHTIARVSIFSPSTTPGEYESLKPQGAGINGAILRFERDDGENAEYGWGSWAVTAPTS